MKMYQLTDLAVAEIRELLITAGHNEARVDGWLTPVSVTEDLKLAISHPPVLSSTPSTIFVRLPKELQRPSLPGTPCQCPYCRTHRDEAPMWDALAVPRNPKAGDLCWTVHHPESR